MSGSITQLLKPPANAQPIAADGSYSKPWADYHTQLTDLVAGLSSQIAQMRTGVVDGSDAKAGEIGEYLIAGGSTALANATAATVAALPLTAGDWMVEGNVSFSGAGTMLQYVAGVSASPGALGSIVTGIIVPSNATVCAIGTGGAVRQNVTAPTTVYLVARSSFTGSMSAAGLIWARRAR